MSASSTTGSTATVSRTVAPTTDSTPVPTGTTVTTGGYTGVTTIANTVRVAATVKMIGWLTYTLEYNSLFCSSEHNTAKSFTTVIM